VTFVEWQDINDEYYIYNTVENALEAIDRTNRIKAGLAQIAIGADYIPRGPSQDEFSAGATFELGRRLLFDPNFDVDSALEVIDQVPKSIETASAYLELGKELASEPAFKERGQAVLRYTSNIYQGIYKDVKEAPLSVRSSFLAQEYCVLAINQRRAGDHQGALETVNSIAPELLEVSELTDKSMNGDKAKRRTLDNALSACTIIIGSLHDTSARELYKSIHSDELKSKILGVLNEEMARILLHAAQPEAAIELLTLNIGDEPQGPISAWQTVNEIIQSGEYDTAAKFVDGVAERFPNYFATSDFLDAEETPMIEVLTRLNRDDLIAQIFKSLVGANSMTAVIKFAYECGKSADGNRLQAVTSDAGLSTEQVYEVYEAYQKGIDQPSQTQEHLP